MNQKDKDRLRELAELARQQRAPAVTDWKALDNFYDACMPESIVSLLDEIEALQRDAACFRFWVREAAVNPCDMAKLIMRCITEQDYRDAIEPLATKADDVIAAAMRTDGKP